MNLTAQLKPLIVGKAADAGSSAKWARTHNGASSVDLADRKLKMDRSPSKGRKQFSVLGMTAHTENSTHLSFSCVCWRFLLVATSMVIATGATDASPLTISIQ